MSDSVAPVAGSITQAPQGLLNLPVNMKMSKKKYEQLLDRMAVHSVAVHSVYDLPLPDIRALAAVILRLAANRSDSYLQMFQNAVPGFVGLVAAWIALRPQSSSEICINVKSCFRNTLVTTALIANAFLTRDCASQFYGAIDAEYESLNELSSLLCAMAIGRVVLDLEEGVAPKFAFN